METKEFIWTRDLQKNLNCTLEDIKITLKNSRNRYANEKSTLGKLYKLYLDIGEDDTLINIATEHVKNYDNFDKNLFLNQLSFPLDPRRSEVNGIKTIELLKKGYTNEFLRSRIDNWPYFELDLLSLKYNTTCHFEAVAIHAEKKQTDFLINHYKKIIIELIKERIIELNYPLRFSKSKRKRISDFLTFKFSKYSYVERKPHQVSNELYQLNETKKKIIAPTQISNNDETTPELKITRQQILYLFALFEKHKIIKEITATKVGRILHELTGFSENTMRIDWKKETLETFETKKNLKNLDNLLKPIIACIETKYNKEL